MPQLKVILIMIYSGAISSSGFPIMSSDPHLDLSKYPNTFYESSYKTRHGNSIFGISVPGEYLRKMTELGLFNSSVKIFGHRALEILIPFL
jgi:hypothetical protein